MLLFCFLISDYNGLYGITGRAYWG